MIAAGLAAGLAGAAHAQLKPGSQQGLGLFGARVPPLLQQIRAEPYRVPADCQAIAEELTQLDAIMGPDVDQPKPSHSIADKAAGYVRDAIPYHGVVRFLTGADNKDKKLQAAANAGYARRGFLRGLQAQRHCDGAGDTRVAQAQPTAAASAVEAHSVDVAARAPDLTASPSARAAADDALADRIDARADREDAQRAETRLRLAAATPPRPAPPGPAPAPAPPAPRSRVVYRLVDATTGRPIVPDEPGLPDPPAPEGGR